ncbi:MAG: oxygenase MpaB family protein [Acidimicrobiales bacterium]
MTLPGPALINDVISIVRREGGNRLRNAISGDEGLRPHEVARADDPGLFGPSSVAWRVHGDAAMLIGGLRALLFQTLHPLAMAGVAEHSDYRRDPWGRLHRTGRFIGGTTFGTTATAESIIATVRAVHDRVVGTAPDGRPYAANDPHLLLWVHATEVDSFLAAYDRYGQGQLTDAERDRYVAEMAEIARRLGVGAAEVPTTVAELRATLDAFRAECSHGPQVREAVRFLLTPPVPLALRGVYGLITAAALGLLPRWARLQLRLPLPPLADPLGIRLPATVLTRSIGWLMSERREMDLDDRLLTPS